MKSRNRKSAPSSITRRQLAFGCPCGRAVVVAKGLCATCYTLRRQDQAQFGGQREQVLARDHHTCQGCSQPGGTKRSLSVHHRPPRRSVQRWMITLCPRCHTRIHRILVLRVALPPTIYRLWRELHPVAHEQHLLPFPEPGVTLPAATAHHFQTPTLWPADPS